MGEERSTVTVSPLVRKRSGGILWSSGCSESSFTWYLLLAVGGTLGESRSSIKDVDCWPWQLIKWENWVVEGCQTRINDFGAAVFVPTVSRLDQAEIQYFFFFFFELELIILSQLYMIQNSVEVLDSGSKLPITISPGQVYWDMSGL